MVLFGTKKKIRKKTPWIEYSNNQGLRMSDIESLTDYFYYIITTKTLDKILITEEDYLNGKKYVLDLYFKQYFELILIILAMLLYIPIIFIRQF